MSNSTEFGKRMAAMVLFLERMANSNTDFYVEDPLELGEDFLKLGVYVVRDRISREQFFALLKELWDTVPHEESEEAGETIFEA